MLSKQRKFDPFTLVIGILSVALGGWFGYIAYTKPKEAIYTTVLLFGLLALLDGIFKLCDISIIDSALKTSTGWVIANAVLDIIIGGLMLFSMSFGVTFIWIMLALFFIMDSLFELWFSQYIKRNEKGYYWLDVILGIIGVILGIALLFMPYVAVTVAVWLVVLYFLFFGILLLVRSF